MKIGIFGGSFDPPHIGHVYAAIQAKEALNLDQMWLVPSYSAKSYGKKLSDGEDRAHMTGLMAMDYGLMWCSLMIEKKLKYTYQIVKAFEKEWPHNEFHIILGGDWDIKKFKSYEKIKWPVHIVRRPGGYETGCESIFPEINFNLSSSVIRKRIGMGLKFTGLVHPSVEQYIKEKKLYGYEG